jgi:DNA-binding NtrC family response regulator
MPEIPAVLVVDDDTSVRTALERVLRKHGYEVVGAATSREAIALARRARGRSTVAIIDLDLGPVSGLALSDTSSSVDPGCA